MTLVYLSAALAVIGLVVLGAAGARLVVAARSLKSEIAEANEQLQPRRARLAGQGDESAPPAAYDRG